MRAQTRPQGISPAPRPRSRLRNLPNVISLSRLVLAALFVAGTRDTRLAIVGVAAATDFLDGWVARRVGAASRSGALIDPISDRVFTLVAVTTFLLEGTLTTLGYFVMISRDLMTAVGFLVARAVRWLRPVEFRSLWSGKVVTALQLAVFVALLVAPSSVATTPLLVVVGVASLWAVADYTALLWRERAR